MKTTNTTRTATEQLLLSNAIDKTIDQIDFSILAGKAIYLDVSPLATDQDANYLSSSIRQQVLSCGAILKEKKEDADYIVEVRAGTLGTDEQQIVYGIPELTVPTFVGAGTVSIPEIAVAKKMGQSATAKIAVFAYNRKTGMPLWQSGMKQADSNVRSRWLLGGGPYRTGDIVDEPMLAGYRVRIPMTNLWDKKTDNIHLNVCDQAYFVQGTDDPTNYKGKPVIRMADAPKGSPNVEALIAKPEGLSMPQEEKQVAFDNENSGTLKEPNLLADSSVVKAEVQNSEKNTEQTIAKNGTVQENSEIKQVTYENSTESTEKVEPIATVPETTMK